MEPPARGQDRFPRLSDVMPHFHLQGGEEFRDLTGRAFDDHIHPPVGQIPHKAGHLEPGGQRPGRVPEPDPLDAAQVVNLACCRSLII